MVPDPKLISTNIYFKLQKSYNKEQEKNQRRQF